MSSSFEQTDIEKLKNYIIEFYDKISSWENQVVKNEKFTLAQVHTVEALGEYGEMTMKELASKLGITTGTLTVQVDKLVTADLIERLPHQTDRRSTIVALTPVGRKLYQKHDQMHSDLTKKITAKLSPQQKHDLLTYLELMNQEL